MAEPHDMALDEDDLNRLYQYAFALSQHRDDAYDLLQDCVEKYLKTLTQDNRAIDNPTAFVRTLIRNRFIDHYRHRQRWLSEPFDDDVACDMSAMSLEQICIDADSLRRIWRQLALLDRDILYHWAVLGYSTDEVSSALEGGRRRSWRQQLRYPFVAACALLLVVAAALWQAMPNSENIRHQIALEAAHNHLQLKPLDISAQSMRQIQEFFTQLDFSPINSSLLSTRFELQERQMLGGRYCSIQGVTKVTQW